MMLIEISLLSAALKESEYGALWIIICLAASSVIVFPITGGAIVLFGLGHEKRKDDIEQAKENGTEPNDERYREYYFFGTILMIPFVIWVFNLLRIFI